MRHPVHIATVATLGAIIVGAGVPDLRADDIADLKAQIRELDQKLRILERKQDIDREAAVEKAKAAPILTAGASGFSLQSANSNFVLKFKGLIQADARLYPDDHADRTGRDGFLIRRARPIVEATMYEKYDFRLMLDFGSGLTSSASNIGFLQEGYVNARFTPQFQVQVGKFKEPVGLERLQSDSTLSFIERGYPTQLVPNRDAGIQIHGDVFNNTLNYAIGAFNGVADGGSIDTETLDDEKDIAARLFATPFVNTKIDALRGLGFGIAGTYGNQSGALANFVTAGQQKFFGYRTGTGANPATANVVADGDHWRLAPQANYYWGPLGLGCSPSTRSRIRLSAATPALPASRGFETPPGRSRGPTCLRGRTPRSRGSLPTTRSASRTTPGVQWNWWRATDSWTSTIVPSAPSPTRPLLPAKPPPGAPASTGT
jgi:phosphate-selective porin OprO/OprP